MEETVVGFCDPLPEKVMGEVAIIAGCDVFMAGIKPSVVVVLHDMAILTGCRVVRKVRRAMAVNECKETKSSQETQHKSNRKR